MCRGKTQVAYFSTMEDFDIEQMGTCCLRIVCDPSTQLIRTGVQGSQVGS